MFGLYSPITSINASQLVDVLPSFAPALVSQALFTAFKFRVIVKVFVCDTCCKMESMLAFVSGDQCMSKLLPILPSIIMF